MKLNSRGAHTIEYALILACSIAVGVIFSSGDAAKWIAHPLTELEALVEGKKAVADADDFWTAIKKDRTTIHYVGKNHDYHGIMDYLTSTKLDLTSGAAEIKFTSTGGGVVVEGVDYMNAGAAINAALESTGYIGHEDMTWYIKGGSDLYVYNQKLEVPGDVGKTYDVVHYDLKHPDAPGITVKAKFVKSSKGNYGVLTPM